MKVLSDAWLIFVRYLMKALRAPMWIIFGMMQSVLYLVLYMPLLKNLGGSAGLPIGQIVQIFVPGMLVMMAISNFFAGFGFIPEIRQGFVTRLLVTPVSRVAMILGMLMNQMVNMVLQGTLLLVIGYLLGLRTSLLAIILTFIIVVLITTITSSCSFIFSIMTKDEMGLASFVNMLFLPIMLLSGIMLPIALAPQWIQTAAHFNPFYYALEATRALFVGNFAAPIIWQGFAIMLVASVITVWLCVKTLKTMTA
jgi:ABC-2 type transport system permease protein